jgi:hypothetical protein
VIRALFGVLGLQQAYRLSFSVFKSLKMSFSVPPMSMTVLFLHVAALSSSFWMHVRGSVED